jgi:diguanylate cyclase (GGDEF)-like protein
LVGWLLPGSLALLLAVSGLARAHGAILQLRHDLDYYQAGSHVDYLADPWGEWSVEEVTRGLPAERFRPSDGRILNLNAASSAYWLRLKISAPVGPTALSSRDRLWLFDPGCPFMEDPTVFLVAPSGGGASSITPLPTAGSPTGLPPGMGGLRQGTAIMLPRLNDRPYTLYWRIQSYDGMLLHPVLCTMSHYVERSARQRLWLGLFLGILLALLLYNLFLFVSLRERSYLWYSVYIFFMGLYFFEVSQQVVVGLIHFPSSLPTRGALLALGGAMAMAGCFARAFLKTADRLPRLDVALRFFIGAAVLVTIISICMDMSLARRVSALLGLGVVFLLVGAGLLAWRSGARQARYYLPAVFVSGGGGILHALVFLGMLPCNDISFYGFQVGIALEALLLALALADRIHCLQREREVLRQSERRHMTLAFTDSLTGLFNVRFFRTHIDVEMQRAGKLFQPLTLMMFDIDNFKQFNDRYGHLAGDRVLRILGRVISDSVRDRDVACRYGGEEFAVILSGSSYLASLEIHRRINAVLQQQLVEGPDGLPAHVTLSVGVAEYILGEEIDDFIQRADTALYAAKERGRDQLVFADSQAMDESLVSYYCL